MNKPASRITLRLLLLFEHILCQISPLTETSSQLNSGLFKAIAEFSLLPIPGLNTGVHNPKKCKLVGDRIELANIQQESIVKRLHDVFDRRLISMNLPTCTIIGLSLRHPQTGAIRASLRPYSTACTQN